MLKIVFLLMMCILYYKESFNFLVIVWLEIVLMIGFESCMKVGFIGVCLLSWGKLFLMIVKFLYLFLLMVVRFVFCIKGFM